MGSALENYRKRVNPGSTNPNTNTFLSGNSIFEKTKGVRVYSIVLNSNHPRFNELGGWNALGAIEYTEISSKAPSGTQTSVAYPFYPNIKHYPLINEIVYILDLPSNKISQALFSSVKKYYLDSISLWNHPHHNALPPPPTPDTSLEILNDYQSTAGGLVRRIVDDPNVDNPEGTEASGIFLGNTFKEKANIHPLLPFEGDIIYEGRWGNSIRFGSTNINRYNINQAIENYNWWSESSDKKNSGDPITIIRNGQGNRSEEGWSPITENPDIDNSSIYLTSTQKLSTINETFSKLENRGYNVGSYKNSNTPLPTSLEQYSNPQILLNSNRIVLNTSTDSIILNSFNGIHLSTPASTGNINLDSNVITMDSNFIYLGNQSVAIEPIVLGNKLLDTLRLLLESFSKMNDALSKAKTEIVIEGKYATLFELRTTAKMIKPTLDEIKKLLGTSNEDSVILSKTTFTKE
jgi:hypothetical protein